MYIFKIWYLIHFMTVYTDSLTNLKNYGIDYFKIAVAINLSYNLQSKVDAWFNDLAPSIALNKKFEQDQIDWDEFAHLYEKEMVQIRAKSKIRWIKQYSKNRDVVLLCYESESDPKCHRYGLKKLIEN